MAQQTSSDEQTQLQLTQPTFDMSILSRFKERSTEGRDKKDFATPSSWAVLKLPRFILLKGVNGKYLRTESNGINNFLAESPMDATVFEVFSMPDGAVRIMSTFNDKFLIVEILAIMATYLPTDLPTDWRTCFWPVKLGRGTDSNLMGLRFVYHYEPLGVDWEATFIADSDDNQRLIWWVYWAKNSGFVVEEPVSRRQIYGVQYHMQDAKISDHEPLTSVTKDVKNWSISPQKGVLSFSHTESESHTWGSTDFWKVSASVGISVRIPFIGGTDITTEAYYSGAYEWGESQETAKQIGTQLEVEIPPMSMVQATMIVQKGKLEVPFSYGQTDALFNGNSSILNFPDGVFTGVNTYVTFHTIKLSLA